MTELDISFWCLCLLSLGLLLLVLLHLRRDKMTKILSCDCQHAAQDRLHGSGKRVHNLATKKSNKDSATWRCTVCRAERKG